MEAIIVMGTAEEIAALALRVQRRQGGGPAEDQPVTLEPGALINLDPR